MDSLHPDLLPTLQSFCQSGASLLMSGTGKLGLPLPAADLSFVEAMVSSKRPGCFGPSVPPISALKVGSLPPTPDPGHPGTALLLQSFVQLDVLAFLIGATCAGFTSSALDAAFADVSSLMRTAGCAGPLLPSFGRSRFGLPAAVLDHASSGLFLAIRSPARSGLGLSTVGDATFGGNVNLVSPSSTRHVGYLDMSPLALGGVCFDLPPIASDSLHLGLLLPLHSLACPETVSSISASSRSDAFLPLRQLAQPGSPSMPIGTACLESTLAVHDNVYPGFAIHFNGGNNYIYYDTGATELRVHAGGLKRMSISSTGGSLHGTWSSESIISASDQRLKRRIEPLEGTLASRAVQRTSSERGSEGESDRAKAVGWLLRD
eukprot:s1917_g12.t1